jgi:hypothetical protein
VSLADKAALARRVVLAGDSATALVDPQRIHRRG